MIFTEDESSYGLGVLLIQIQPEGHQSPVASSWLIGIEQHYSQVGKEAFAVTWD